MEVKEGVFCEFQGNIQKKIGNQDKIPISDFFSIAIMKP